MNFHKMNPKWRHIIMLKYQHSGKNTLEAITIELILPYTFKGNINYNYNMQDMLN